MFQILDIALVGIMIVSALLALMRGFTREVLSLLAWGAAAIAAILAVLNPRLVEFAQQYVEPPVVAKIGLGGVVFIAVLIIASLISVKVSDYVVDSSAGAFDRSLGFLYGLARGLVLVTIAYIFYGWLTPPENQEPWIRNAQTLPVIERVKGVILSVVPADISEMLNNIGIPSNPERAAPKTAEPGTEGQADPAEQGYTNGQTQGLDQAIEGSETKPAFGGGTTGN